MLSAAWLHDTVEDCGVSDADIDIHFGPEVSRLVWWLTAPSKLSDGNRATRKRKDAEFLEGASDAAKTIKLADLIDNSFSIVPLDPGFAKIYIEEKADLLPRLLGGDPRLMFMAQQVLTMSRITLRAD